MPTVCYCRCVHASREGQVPKWFEAEGFEPAIDPDFDAWRIRTYSVEIPTEDRPTGRVVCEVRGLPDVRVAIQISIVTGQMVGIEVGDRGLFGSAVGDPKPISARLLREIPFGEIERSARASLRWELAVRHHHEAPHIRATLNDGGARLRDSLTRNPRPGRRGRSDASYASLAAAYVERLESRAPVADLAAAWDYSDSRVRNLLHEARRRGLLTRPAPGKSGGQLTKKAIDLLQNNEEG
jgi:hypothetical protein